MENQMIEQSQFYFFMIATLALLIVPGGLGLSTALTGSN
jgi:hypothetical protein